MQVLIKKYNVCVVCRNVRIPFVVVLWLLSICADAQLLSTKTFNCDYSELTKAYLAQDIESHTTNIATLQHMGSSAKLAEEDSLAIGYFNRVLKSSSKQDPNYYKALVNLYSFELRSFNVDSIRRLIITNLGNDHDVFHVWNLTDASFKLRASSKAKTDSIILASIRAIKNPQSYAGVMAFALQVVSKTFAESGKLKEAKNYSLQALHYCQEYLPDCHPTIGMGHFSLGRRYYNQNQLDSALIHLSQAWEIFERKQPIEYQGLAQVALSMAECYVDQFDLIAGLRYLDSAAAYAQVDSAMLNTLLPRVFNRKASIFSNLGKHNKAREYYLKSIRFAEGSTEPIQKMAGYTNLSGQLILIEDFETARNYLDQALEICLSRLGENHTYTAIILMKLGGVYYFLNEYQKTEEYYNRSLNIRKKLFGDHHSYVANAYTNIGIFYRDIKQFEKAIENMNLAINSYRKSYGETNVHIAGAYNRRASVYMRMGRIDKAMQDIENGKEALACSSSFHTCSDPFIYLDFIEKEVFAKMYHLGAPIDSVISLCEYGDRVFNQLFEWAESPDDINDLVSNYTTFYKMLISALVAAFQNSGDEKNVRLAAIFSNKIKSLGLLQSLRRRFEYNFANVPEKLRVSSSKLRRELSHAERALHQLDVDSRAHDSLLARIVDLNETFSKNEKLIEEDYPLTADLQRMPKRINLELLQSTLPDSMAFLDYVTSDSSLMCIVVTNEKVQAITTELNWRQARESIRQWLKGVASQGTIFELEQELEMALTAPLSLLSTHVNKIVVSPDDLLAIMPFELLSTGDNRWLDRYSISYANSLDVWTRQQESPIDDMPNVVSIFAPIYSQSNGDVGVAREGLTALPYSQEEANFIRENTAGRTQVFTENLKEHFLTSTNNSAIVHLSMHTLLDDNQPMNSRFLFSPKTDNSRDQLYLHELYHLDVKTHLAVLSACETGVGKFENGSGVRSLSTGFQYAGVPSVLMSLWQVPDKSTSEIMKSFYTYLFKGEEKAKALQKAKQDYLSNAISEKSKHPFYWAGFILVGNADPVILDNRSFPIYHIVIGLLVLLLLYIINNRLSRG